ncbi:MAG: acetyltransferase, family [Paenibacillus sp.]|nr:acetyltransferase, family [Paenibacillus sp.]
MRAKEQGLRFPFVIFDKSTSEIVGSTSYLDISLLNRKLEIGGTWLDPKVWRTGVNTECKYLLLKYGFEELNLIRVQFRTDTRNERSNLAIQRIGAQFEGTLRQEMIVREGYIRDSNVYTGQNDRLPYSTNGQRSTSSAINAKREKQEITFMLSQLCNRGLE